MNCVQITAITPQKKHKDRLNIYLDGIFAFGIDLDTLVKNHLTIGRELSDNDVARLTNEGTTALLYNKTLAFISRRPRSEKEIRDYLHKQEVGISVSDLIVTKLKDRKFLDDAEFARWFVEQRSTFRPKGKVALTAELRQKGIDRELISQTLEENSVDEVGLARAALAKKLRQFDHLPADKRKEKIIRFLGSRGFSWDTIGKILNRDID